MCCNLQVNMFWRERKYYLNESKESFEMKKNWLNSKQQRENMLYSKYFMQAYRDYCANSTIHGLPYIGSDRPLKDKLFWLFIFLMSIYCCVVLITSVYAKWNETPVIVSFSEKTTPVWSIPFPAITICSETKRVMRSTEITYGKLYRELTECMQAGNQTYIPSKSISDEELEEFRALLQICNTQIIDEGMPVISNKSIDYIQVLDRMLPEFERYFFYCKWFKYFGDCDELFTRVFTEEGICYTFNGLNESDIYRAGTFQHKLAASQLIHGKQSLILNRTLDWTMQQGFDKSSSVKTYPARVLGAGARAGLFIALQSFKQEVDYACRGPVQGYKVLLHAPDDVPQMSKQYVRIPMGKEVLITVKPNMITTSEGIADYSPMRRQCYMNNERYLRFFKIYTEGNCELECLANFTLQKCGCVKFNMPRAISTPVCDEKKIHCYDRAEDEMLLHEFHQGLPHTTFNHRGETDCNCMPACTSLTYNIEISQGNFDLVEMLAAAGDTQFLLDYPGSIMSRLSIYFKENEFFTSKRSELYGIVDFLANCGGIFGLLIGFSFLSLIEVVYFFTLHFWNVMHANSES